MTPGAVLTSASFDSTFAELAWMLGRRKRTSPFLMLWAYFDESGHEADHSLIAMAGWLGSVEAFSALEHRWNDALKKWDLPEFHAKTISRDFGKCKGWPQARINDLMTDFVSAITTTEGLFGIGCSIKVPDYRRVMGGHPWLAERFSSPYQFCCRMSIELSYEWMRRRPEWADEGLSVAFAPNEAYRADVRRCRDWYVDSQFRAQGSDSPRGRIIDVVTSDPSYRVQLQAADLHAYETFKYAHSLFYTDTPRQRVSYGRLFKEALMGEPVYLDADGLCDFGLSEAARELGLNGAKEIGLLQHLTKCAAANLGRT